MPGDGHLLDRPQAATPERRSQEKLRDARRAVGTLLQLRAQLREARDELRRHPLVGEQIAARRDLIQEGLQRLGDRQLRSVVVGLARAQRGLHPAVRGQRAGGKERSDTQSENEAPGTGRLRGTAWAPPTAETRCSSSRTRRTWRSTATPTQRQRFPPRRTSTVAGPAWPPEPEERAEVVLREIAASGADLAKLLPASEALHFDPRPDGEGIGARLSHLDPEPVVPALLGVLEERGLVVHGAHDEVGIPVVVEVPHRDRPAGLLHGEPPPGRGRHVAEPPSLVHEDLVSLRVALLELGVLVDLGEQVAIREVEVEVRVEVGVEKGQAPAHALEGGGGEPRPLRRVLEGAAAQVPVQAVVVEGEGSDRDVEPAVAVHVASVGAHAGLSPTVGVQRHARREPDALETAAFAVAIEEVGVGVVGHEQIRPAVAVVVGGHHAETVGLRGVGEAELLAWPPRTWRLPGSRRRDRVRRGAPPGPASPWRRLSTSGSAPGAATSSQGAVT